MALEDDREDLDSPSQEDRGRAGEEARGGLPELTKKVLSLGLGAFFLGEDYLRRAVKDAKLPRDIGKSIAQNASKGKEELFGFVARELSQFLRQMDVQAELSRFAATHRIRVTTDIEFIPKAPPAPSEGPPAVAAAELPAEDAAPAPACEDDEQGELDVKIEGLEVRLEPREG
ncbi:hypothetical protein HY251_01020 [bacterium]|nr:hypothetical protein [bacterium]